MSAVEDELAVLLDAYARANRILGRFPSDERSRGHGYYMQIDCVSEARAAVDGFIADDMIAARSRAAS